MSTVGVAARPILIAGGGIGGLAAALAVADAGYSVVVLERSMGASEAGAGIQLGPNAVKVLRRLGIADALAPFVSVPEAVVMRRGRDGGVLSQLPLGETIARRHGAPYWVVLRADLHRVLADAVAGHPRITLRPGAAVVAVDDHGADGVVAVSDTGATIRGTALIGADGLWSRVRRFVAADVVVQPSGYGAYRAVIPQSDAVPGVRVVEAWLSPSAHIVTYPVMAGRALNIVVIVRAEWSGDTWTAPADAAAVGEAIAEFAPAVRDALSAATHWQAWTLAKPIVAPAWSKGRVALLGDAGHAMLPFFAQGGAMALEDAVVLAAALAGAGGDMSGAFVAYALQRRSRVSRVQAASSGNGRIFHLAGAAAFARDVTLGLMPTAVLQRRYDWLYGHDATATAPQIRHKL